MDSKSLKIYRRKVIDINIVRLTMAKELTCIQLESTYSQVMVTRKLKLLKMTVVFITENNNITDNKKINPISQES